MFKGKFLLALFLVLAMCKANVVFCEENQNAGEDREQIVLKIHEDRIGSLPWVVRLMEKYPELAWLADAKVRKTQEWADEDIGKSWSEQLFGKKFVEFERTIASIANMYLILDGTWDSYTQFIANQSSTDKLTFAQFQEIHKRGQKLIRSNPSMLKAFEIALIISDQGKSANARTCARSELGIVAEDHDVFYAQVMASDPSFFPSFKDASKDVQDLIKRFPHTVHFGHVYHIEGGKNMFAKLKESGILKSDPIAFECEIFMHICDVSAAAAHVNNQGSLTYSSMTHKAMLLTEKSLKLLTYRSEKDALDYYIARRAEWLGFYDTNKHDRALTRIAAMLRFFDKESGARLKAAFATLSNEDYVKIIRAFDPDQIRLYRPTPTYIPALLLNLYNNKSLGKTYEERMNNTVKIGGAMVANALQAAESEIQKGTCSPETVLCFNEMAGKAKNNPETIHSQKASVRADGMIVCDS